MVFDALHNAELTLKISKCIFGAIRLEYLGFQIIQGKLRPGRKIEAIQLYPRPQNLHEVQQFLDLAGLFWRFIEGYASIAAPFNQLLRKNTQFR